MISTKSTNAEINIHYGVNHLRYIADNYPQAHPQLLRELTQLLQELKPPQHGHIIYPLWGRIP